MRLAVIGCGKIAGFHINAMRAVGFSIVSVAGSVNSRNVDRFSRDYNIQKIYKNPLDLLNASSEWDALLLLTPPSVTVEYLNIVATLGKPILVEKPVAKNHIDLRRLRKFKNIRVAYNRRFYAGTEVLQKFTLSNPKALVKVTIPELRKDPEHNIDFPYRLPVLTYENSVHIFDLLRYICGEVEWNFLKNIKDQSRYIALLAIGHSARGASIQLDSYYNASENFSISATSGDVTVKMCPLELTNVFCGIEVKEPTDLMPIRLYKPIVEKQVVDMPKDGHKPGFIRQAEDFMNFCIGKKCSGADVQDAYLALEMAQDLLD